MESSLLDDKSIENPSMQIQKFAIIIGSMKSGTSTLFKYLRQHPEIEGSIRKELNFFSSNAKYSLGREFYEAQWPNFDPAIHRYALEASPQYTKAPLVPGVPQRMLKFGGEFRFFYIVRNPVDRIESHLAHNISKGRVPLGASLREHGVSRAIRASSYAAQLDAFRAGLDDPQILILDFDELRRAPLSVAQRCVRFLGLDPVFQFREIKPANVRSPANDANKFRLSPKQRARLAKRLHPDICDFRDRYGFDVSGWKLS